MKKEDKIVLSKKKVIVTASILLTILVIAIAYILINNNKNVYDLSVQQTNKTLTNNPSENNLDGTIVAKYAGKDISENQLDKEIGMILFLQGVPESYASRLNKQAVLNQTIVKELIYSDAKKNGYDISKKDTEAQFENLLKKGGITVTDFKKRIENNTFNYDDLINYNMAQLTITKYINDTLLKNIKVSEEEELAFYNTNKSLFNVKTQIRASHILVNTSAEAKSIIELLNKGANFSELAKEKSIGPSASKGGDLGYFGKGAMVPEFETAAFALQKIGEYTTTPVKTKFGYHIIELTGKQDAKQLTFEESKAKVKAYLLKEKQNEKIKNYVQELVKQANVTIFLK